MSENNLTYSELALLLLFIKSKETIVNSNQLRENSFKWEEQFRLAITMENVGIGHNSAELSDSLFEEIFEDAIILFKSDEISEIEKKLKNFTDYDKIQEISDQLGFSVEITNEKINDELEKLKDYINLINNIFLTYTFSNENLTKMQYDILKKELDSHILNERYEECQVLQDKIKELKI